MELNLIDENGAISGALTVSESLFSRPYNEGLIHQVVTAYRANGRGGNRAQKGRSDIAKSTRKPWRQKGTGRARAGMASSPLWRGGGKIFPSSPIENFNHKVNRKMYGAGVACILSQLVREGRLRVIERFSVAEPKTKHVVQKLKLLGFEGALLISEEIDDNLLLATRNIPYIKLVSVSAVDPVSLVRFENVILTQAAVKRFEEWLA